MTSKKKNDRMAQVFSGRGFDRIGNRICFTLVPLQKLYEEGHGHD
jgi:hypothetical protein